MIKSQMTGEATITYPDGSIYSGQIKDDKRIGQRTLTFPDLEQWFGEYDAKGQGQRIVPYRDSMTDEIRDKQKGIGIYDLPHNRDRVGQFMNGKKTGLRTIMDTSSTKRDGQYQNGKRTGLRDGESPYEDILEAEYKDGKLISSKFYRHENEF